MVIVLCIKRLTRNDPKVHKHDIMQYQSGYVYLAREWNMEKRKKTWRRKC